MTETKEKPQPFAGDGWQSQVMGAIETMPANDPTAAQALMLRLIATGWDPLAEEAKTEGFKYAFLGAIAKRSSLTPQQCRDFYDKAANDTGEELLQADILGDADDQKMVFAFRAFNRQWCHVAEGDGVMYDQRDPFRVERKSFRAIERHYAHRMVEKIGGDGKVEPFLARWLRSHIANKCDATIFRPGGEAYIEAEGKRYLNTWRRLAVEPRKGDWSLMQAHILDVLCAGDPDEYRNVIGWMAWQLQHLGDMSKRLPVVLCFMSEEEGTGKSITWKYWRRIFGHHAKVLSRPDDVVGDKNGALAECVHLTLEEAFFSGDARQARVLKELFSGEEFTLRKLYSDGKQTDNYMSFVVLSNETVPIALTKHSRRIHALTVSPHRKGQKRTYFQPLADQMESGGVEAMAWDLLNWTPPGGDWSFLDRMGEEHTATAGAILKEGLTPFESWVIDWVIDGVPGGTICDGMKLPTTEGETLLYSMRGVAAEFETWWTQHKGDYPQRVRDKVKTHYCALGEPFRDMLGAGITTKTVQGKRLTFLADRNRLRAILVFHPHLGYRAAIQEREAAGGGLIGA